MPLWIKQTFKTVVPLPPQEPDPGGHEALRRQHLPLRHCPADGLELRVGVSGSVGRHQGPQGQGTLLLIWRLLPGGPEVSTGAKNLITSSDIFSQGALVHVLDEMWAAFDLHDHDKETIETLHKYGSGAAMPILYALDFNSLSEIFVQLKVG